MTPNYPPRAYRSADQEAQRRLIRSYPLATFIVAAGGQPYATSMPMVLSEDGSYLLTHMDANNPAGALVRDGARALAIFHGPSVYISPADYHSKQLPTYNYQQVHVHGTLERIEDRERAREDLYALSRAMEPEGRWALPEEDPRVDPLLPHIVALRLHVERMDGRFKLSQDKRPADQQAAMDKLRREGGCPVVE